MWAAVRRIESYAFGGRLSTAPRGTEYVFVEEGVGKQITVARNTGLSKRAMNHRVTITTASTPAADTGAAGAVSKSEDVSDSRTAK